MRDYGTVAYCGLVCAECPAYIATQAHDDELLRKTAERWSSPDVTIMPEDIRCDGCSGGGRMTTFCSVCRVRACATGRSLDNCGLCDDYPCGLLGEHWKHIKAGAEAKPVLDEIRRRRGGR
jgi:hypothetical protein